MKKEGLFSVLRIFMGLTFLWPFLDKLFGLGFTTAADKSWLLGNSPTYGFLAMATKGPFAFAFKAIAGNIFVDWLFMIGLLFIGVGLIFGVAMRISCYSGTLLLVLMWLAVLPPEHNPVIDEHIIYGLMLIILTKMKTPYSLSSWWSSLKIVKKNKWLE